MYRVFVHILLIVCLPLNVGAENVSCWADIQSNKKPDEAERIYLEQDEFFHLEDDVTFREVWRRDYDACYGETILNYLTPDLTVQERDVFCLQYNKETKVYEGFAVGEQDAYGHCKLPSAVCNFVNARKEEVLALAGFGTGAVAGTGVATTAAGVTAVTHSSGAIILTGNAGYIAGTLGTAGAATVGVLTAPATVVATGVAVVTTGGVLYFCGE